MKLCITSSGRDLDKTVDENFGRASCFLIVDTENDSVEVVDNTAADQAQGAGIAAAQIVSDLGVDGVLTGSAGRNACDALEAAGIKLFTGASSRESVREALARLKQEVFNESPMTEELSQSVKERWPGRGIGCGRGRGQGRGGGQCQPD